MYKMNQLDDNIYPGAQLGVLRACWRRPPAIWPHTIGRPADYTIGLTSFLDTEALFRAFDGGYVQFHCALPAFKCHAWSPRPLL